MISHVGRRAVAAASPPLIGFAGFKSAVARQFRRLATHALFRTDMDGDSMWERYLSSFPSGSNPVFRVRTEHDCSCCRQFVRAVGNAVAVVDGRLESVWDVALSEGSVYRDVASAMAALVKSRPIADRFLHAERTAGTDRSHEDDGAGAVRTWEHFFVEIPRRNDRGLVCPKAEIGSRLAEARSTRDVLARGLSELTRDALETVLDLIDRNALYRGEENRHAVAAFADAKRAFDAKEPEDRDGFVWLRSVDLPPAVSRLRGTAIGQLLVDLSAGRDEESAVAAFERMVAPANYRRPTALVTPRMVAQAKAAVEALGLASALERRYATVADVTVDNVLFADRGARSAMADGAGVFDEIARSSAMQQGRPADLSRVEQIGIDEFLSGVLPGADSLEVLLEGRLAGNLVSLVAPVDPGSALLFKWGNRFSWSYSGDVADGIRERVRKAGGSVDGVLCCRLGWFNRDDLDLHMREPDGNEVFFAQKGPSRLGGRLDVDMNVHGETREPVENIFYGSEDRMRDGVYRLFVHQFQRREGTDVGFDVEVDWKGTVRRFSYAKPLRTGQAVTVAVLRYSRASGVEFVESLPASAASRRVWGLDTEAFHRVGVAMLSPNHWDGEGVGNRHWFFMLDGCRNDGTARGFYNEFLRPDLDRHRKVLEAVGARTRTDDSSAQLSGLGFSSTLRNHAVFRRGKGGSVRTVRVNF